jgi:hypothetical protein
MKHIITVEIMQEVDNDFGTKHMHLNFRIRGVKNISDRMRANFLKRCDNTTGNISEYGFLFPEIELKLKGLEQNGQ